MGDYEKHATGSGLCRTSDLILVAKNLRVLLNVF
jgi:hypothetical protein